MPKQKAWSMCCLPACLPADVLSSPGPFLQLQIAALSCDWRTAELRAQLTATQEAVEAVGDSAAVEELLPQLPVLLSDPEPAWLDLDTKQR